MDILCIQHHLLGVKVNRAVIDTKFVLPEERDAHFLHVEIDNLSHDLCAAYFFVVSLDTLREKSDAIDLLGLGHEVG